MSTEFAFEIKSTRFDEHYRPADNTRLTTNFANLARGEHRQDNLRNALRMIDNRFNTLAHWDNPDLDRYSVVLDIISVEASIDSKNITSIPLIELLQTQVIDHKTGKRIEGIVGNNFSSYVRDYDFSVLLRDYNKDRTDFSTPDEFGDLHGKIFQCFLRSETYKQYFNKQPVICLSVAGGRTYRQTCNRHPVLGIEYQQDAYSLTDEYFSKMGLQVRYFMPENGVAPLAFYFSGDLLNDYTDLELISTISTMESFQKIYRPEIYNANAVAGKIYQPSLSNQNFSLTRVVYDREERSRLATEQGEFTEECFIKPYKDILAQWSAAYTL